MTQEIANSWWNQVANYGINLDLDPILPSPSRMCEICQELSPIFQTHLSLLLPEKEFWMEARNIGKTITHIDPFPDPVLNFPLFILYIYTFRDIFKPSTVDNCILYASSLCPSPPGDFFINKFIFALSDPVLVVLSFHKMQESKNHLWISFLQQPGMAERIFDLYLPHFLIPLESADDFSELSIKIYLADFLSQLLISNPNISFFSKFAILLYKSILLIVESVQSGNLISDSYAFLPIILSLSEFSITSGSTEFRRSVSEKIIGLPNKKNPFVTNILEWAFLHTDIDYLKPREIALSLITKTKTSLFWTIAYLGKLLSKYPNETSSIIIPFFSKILFFDTTYMKLVMEFISNYFNLESADKRVREWFVVYIRYVFVSIKIFCLKKKYINRIVSFLSVLSESSLMNIDFIKNIVLQSAQLCLSRETNFLTYFFDLKSEKIEKENQTIKDENCPKYVINSIVAFNQEVKILSAYKTKKIPFRKSGNSLLPIINGAITEANFFIDPNVADLGINSKFSPFIYIDETMEPSTQNLIKYSLEEIIEHQNALIKDCYEAKTITSTFFDASKISSIFSTFATTISSITALDYYPTNSPLRSSASCSKLSAPSLFNFHSSSSFSSLQSFSGLECNQPFYVSNQKLFLKEINNILKEIEQEIFDFQKNMIESFITMTKDLIQILDENPHLGVNSKKLLLYFEKEKTDLPKYSEIKDKKNTLIIYTRNIYHDALMLKPPKISFTNKLSKAYHLFVNSYHHRFLPFNDFDIFFADYINQDRYKSLINAVVELVTSNNDNSFSFTVDGIVEKLINENITNICNIHQHDKSGFYSILYSSLIRVIFNTAYDNNSDLFQKNEDSLIFIRRAETLSQQPLQILNPEFHKYLLNITINDQIRSFFQQKQMPNLKWLIFETNPLDICYEIHKTAISVTKEMQIPKKAISKNIMESVIYGLIISNPPENIIGIARLLIKWNNIYVTEELEEIRSLFIKSVSRVIMIEL